MLSQSCSLKIPESGHPDDYNVEEATSFPTMEEQDEGEVWMHKVVHGFRWYKVRVVSRLDSDQVPIFGRHRDVSPINMDAGKGV